MNLKIDPYYYRNHELWDAKSECQVSIRQVESELHRLPSLYTIIIMIGICYTYRYGNIMVHENFSSRGSRSCSSNSRYMTLMISTRAVSSSTDKPCFTRKPTANIVFPNKLFLLWDRKITLRITMVGC